MPNEMSAKKQRKHIDSLETHPWHFRRGQHRVEVARLKEDAGQTSIRLGAQGNVVLHAVYTPTSELKQTCGKHVSGSRIYSRSARGS